MALTELAPLSDDKKRTGMGMYVDTPLPFGGRITKGFPKDYTFRSKYAAPAEDVPKKLLDMIGLYEYGDGSLYQRSKNFYIQGKFAEDYEDDEEWKGEFKRYFTTYHDLNIKQLRGYFTWRKDIRKGSCYPISTSLAYMYVYELLSQIGTDSPEDSVRKLREFEKGYIDSGIGDQGMRRNIRKWCMEFAIIHGLPPETAREFSDPEILEKDHALAVLKDPAEYSDDEIFSALCAFSGKKLAKSSIIKNEKVNGRHLFSEVWRYLSANYEENGKSIFTACFGRQRAYAWYPLSNAIHFEREMPGEMDYYLDESRSYHLRYGRWEEKRYEKIYFDKDRFAAIIHEADRLFRKTYKTGYYLREKVEEAWVSPYITAVLEQEKRAKEEAARPKINIDFSDLDRIRADAVITRDSLLTEEEKFEEIIEEALEETAISTDEISQVSNDSAIEGLDGIHYRILIEILKGNSITEQIENDHLMPSVVADTINEAMFDEIGDNILECDGNDIIFDDIYREDVMDVLGDILNE